MVGSSCAAAVGEQTRCTSIQDEEKIRTMSVVDNVRNLSDWPNSARRLYKREESEGWTRTAVYVRYCVV